MKKLIMGLLVGALSVYLLVVTRNWLVQYAASDLPQTKNTASAVHADLSGSKYNQEVISEPSPLRVAGDFIAANGELSQAAVITLTNAERNKAGLKNLAENSELDASATAKLHDMDVKKYFAHVSPDGRNVGDLAGDAGYEYIILGENLALGDFNGDQGLVNAWMASPGHRANILNKNYSEIGVAVGRADMNGRETWLAVQHFGLPQSACPEVDSNIKSKITDNETKISSLEKSLGVGGGLLATVINSINPIAEIRAAEYKKLVSGTNDLISQYNSQVKLFNDCLNSTK